MKKESTIWVEKYRPQTIKDFIGNEQIVAKFQEFIDKKEIQNILLHAHAGSGKTTMGKILTNSIPCDVLYINASDENNADTVRTKIKNFAMTKGFSGMKVVFLDEGDAISNLGQSILRNLIETYSSHCRFILTCNYLEKILDPIKSRFQVYHVTPPNQKEVLIRLAKILKQEKVKFKKEDIVQIVKTHFPDIRRCIMACQQYTIGGVLKLDSTSLNGSKYEDKIIELLKNDNLSISQFYAQSKKIIADSNAKSFESLIKRLYDKISDYANGKEPYIIKHIATSQYEYSFVVEKEITIMALLSLIFNTIND